MIFLPLIGIFEGLLLYFLILSKKKKSISDYILSAIFLLFSVYLGLLYIELYNRNNNYPYPSFIHSSVPIIYLYGPLIWIYVKSLTDQKFKLQFKYLVHLIPCLAFIVYLYFEVYRLPAGQKILSDSAEIFKKEIVYPVSIIGIALSTQGYFIAALVKIRKFNLHLKSYFSKVENIDLKWMKFFLVTTIFFFASFSILYIFDFTFNMISYNSQEQFVFILANIYIPVIGFYGHWQGNVFTKNVITVDLDRNTDGDYIKKTVDKTDESVNFLMEYMKSKKPYLDPEIHLAKLSSELNISPEFLSNIINDKLNRNFFDFINYYRIEEFKEKCKTPENKKLTILAIAFSCGFNSKATFNRVFKKVTGYTPRQYINEVSE